MDGWSAIFGMIKLAGAMILFFDRRIIIASNTLIRT